MIMAKKKKSTKEIELELKVPTELAGIKLHQYQKYVKVLNGIEDTTNSEAIEFLNLKSLEIFCGMALKESYGLPLSVFDSVIKQLSNCLSEEAPLIQRFKMTGSDGVTVEFGFVPKLDEISFGEYIDVERYISDWENMHKAMAVLYRPIVAGAHDMYLIEEYKGSDRWAEVMKDTPLNVAFGATLFFYRLGKKLSRYTILSLQQELAKTHSPLEGQKADLQKSGDGISQFMALQEEMYEGLMKLPNFHYINV